MPTTDEILIEIQLELQRLADVAEHERLDAVLAEVPDDYQVLHERRQALRLRLWGSVS